MRFCTDYSYFHVGVACGDLLGSLVATIHLGFWSLEFTLINREEV